MRMLKSEIFPVSVVLVTDEEDYNSLMKRVINPTPYPIGMEAITSDFGGGIFMVVLGETSEARTDDEIISILTHEAVHLAQDTLRYINEDKVGTETLAYLIQYFAKYLVREWRYRESKKNVVEFKPDEQG